MRAKILLLLLLAAAPAPLAAQQPPPAAEARGPRQQRPPAQAGPVQLLLEQRAELGLTDAQVARLEAIRRTMEERNRPLLARLLEIRRGMPRRVPPPRMTPAQRERFERGVREARPLLERIRENNRASMAEVGEVLTAEQKSRIREMLRDHRPERGPRHRGGEGRGHGPGRGGG